MPPTSTIPPLFVAQLSSVLIQQGQEDVLADVLDFLFPRWTAELLKNYRNAVRDDSGIFGDEPAARVRVTAEAALQQLGGRVGAFGAWRRRPDRDPIGTGGVTAHGR